jgi:hypothetical protein
MEKDRAKCPMDLGLLWLTIMVDRVDASEKRCDELQTMCAAQALENESLKQQLATASAAKGFLTMALAVYIAFYHAGPPFLVALTVLGVVYGNHLLRLADRMKMYASRQMPEKLPGHQALAASHHQPPLTMLVAALSPHPITEDGQRGSKNKDGRKRHPYRRPQVSAHLPRVPHTERHVLFQIGFAVFARRARRTIGLCFFI